MNRLILATIFILISSFLTFAEVHNVELSLGQKKVLKGSVRSGEGNEELYIFEAKDGQKLTVNLSSINSNAAFSVNEQYRVDRSPIEVDGKAVEDKNEEWSGNLPKAESNGLYSVSVTSTKGTASFTLEMTLGNSESSTDSNSADPQSIKDYYLLMPKKYDGATFEEREEILGYESDTVIDLNNGYIKYETRAAGEVFEVALFKYNGEVFIAYNEDCDLENNQLTKMYFLHYDGGRWIDVTGQAMPIPINKKYKYKLPQKGTTIQVTTANGKRMYNLLWKNGKFIKGT
ncbi:MAG: hypothetical protein K1X72_22395 [Pyrinomonadaceae bacterium]|nr:hypothetical protein [Pyrinomonadaceae bacterium]